MAASVDLPREHQCPICGHYIWAHPIKVSANSPVETDICSLSTGGAQEAYDKRMEEYRQNATIIRN